MTPRPRFPGLLLIAGAMLLLLASCGREGESASVPEVARGDAVTFLVTADTHLGFEGLYEANERQVLSMNRIPGTPWPPEIGGAVDRPSGVLVAGDLTDAGRPEEWKSFVRLYGLRAGQGLLAYPVFEGAGNHDEGLALAGPVPGAIALRHGSREYAFRVGGLLVLCLGVYPDAAALPWLGAELAKAGHTRPVVCFFHYPLTGPYGDWWTEGEKEAFGRTIDGYRIVAIFHGHYHRSTRYEWHGIPVFDVGSPHGPDHSFAVVHWHAGRLEAAGWDWDRGRWVWERVVER